jgi:hypothetical protein
MESIPKKWTAEDLKLLVKLRMEIGLKFSEIARHPEMKKRRPEITREAVGGKLSRLGLCKKKPRPKDESFMDTDVENCSDENFLRITAADRESSLLPNNENLCFCGKVKFSRNYCLDHLKEYVPENFAEKIIENRKKRIESGYSNKLIEN